MATEEAYEDNVSQLEHARRTPPPYPTFQPNYESLHLAALHRVHGHEKKRIQSANSRHKAATGETRSTIRRRQRRTISSSAASVEDDCTSYVTESDMVSDMRDLDESVYQEDDPLADSSIRQENYCLTVYRRACAKHGILPASSVLRQLTTDKLDLSNHVIGPTGAATCAISLVDNVYVEMLNLEGNALGPVGTLSMCQMLQENANIVDLNLSDNNIGTEGLKELMKVMSVNTCIHTLTLAGNRFTDADAVYIAEMLTENVRLHSLDLSYNEFREQGGVELSEALVDNTTLQDLNLSWNHLREKGAQAIAFGLQRNISLKKVNLGWNGFHVSGCRVLSRALEVNVTLEELDLSCNRIGDDCLEMLLHGINNNPTLTHLSLANNSLSTKGALSILRFLETNLDSPIVFVNISGQDVTSEFCGRYRALCTSRTPLQILYGLTLQTDYLAMVQDDSVFIKEDPMMVLMEYMRLKNLRLVDLFHSFDVDKNHSLSMQEFRVGLMKSNIPLTECMLEHLIKKLDLNKNGEVEFSELIDGQKEHKRKITKLLDATLSKSVPFERTQIGRVSYKLKMILRITDHFWTDKIGRLTKQKTQLNLKLGTTEVTKNGS